jgi:hypothetical protein
MNTTSLLRSLLTAILLIYGSAHAADAAIQVVRDQSGPVAQFKIGDSHCVLKNDQIRCTPPSK